MALDTGSGILQRYRHAPRRHGELLLPWVDELMAEAGMARSQLQAVCVGCGPGSFTSLRMGFSVAVGIAYALDLPVYPVSSLQTLAVQAFTLGAEYAVTALDARMGEVYIGSYSNSLNHYPKALHKEKLIAPADYHLPDINSSSPSRWYAIGNGFSAMQGQLEGLLEGRFSRVCADLWPQARDMFILAERVSPVPADQAELSYLRNQVVQT